MFQNDKKDIYNLKNIALLVCFTVVFGLCFSVAHQLVLSSDLKINILEWIKASTILFIVLLISWEIIKKVNEQQLFISYQYDKKEILFIWGLNIVVNLICLFTYFPGVGMNDGLNIMIGGMSQSQQFPIMYCAAITLITKIGAFLGSLQYSVVIYSIIQILCVSALYTWIVVWFSKKCTPKCLKYIILIYFLLEPLLAMYAISMLKDTLFSLLLLVLMMLVYDLVIDVEIKREKIWWIFFAIVIFGILTLRNNGSYIIFPILIMLFFCCPQNRKGIICMFFCAISTIVLLKILMIWFGTEQLFQELVGIPLQQIAAVVANNGNIAPEQAEFLNKLMPLEEMAVQYNPSSADAIKWNSMFDRGFLNEHKVEFLITWAKMLPENFLLYVKAYLQQTFWFWAPWQEGTVQCLYSIETVSDNSWLVEFLKTSGIHDQPLLPAQLNNLLRSWYQLGNKFFREGVCFWIMLSTLVLSVLKNRNWRMILVYAPALLLWLTIMISTPVAESMRYVFVFAYALPFFVGVLFIKRKVKEVNI